MSALLEFMYKGEVHVSQEALNSFLKAAENLQVRFISIFIGLHPSFFLVLNFFTYEQNHDIIRMFVWNYRLKVCQLNMDVWLQRNHSHMNKTEDTKETVHLQHHHRLYPWIYWNKSVIHWIQVVRDWVAVSHHTYRKCTGRLTQHAIENNAAHSANQRLDRVCYAMDHEAVLKIQANDYGMMKLYY